MGLVPVCQFFRGRAGARRALGSQCRVRGYPVLFAPYSSLLPFLAATTVTVMPAIAPALRDCEVGCCETEGDAVDAVANVDADTDDDALADVENDTLEVVYGIPEAAVKGAAVAFVLEVADGPLLATEVAIVVAAREHIPNLSAVGIGHNDEAVAFRVTRDIAHAYSGSGN
jgi:hypothetical protein